MGEEHTPSPQEPRGIYGFVLMLLMNSLTLMYFIWMLAPESWIESLPYRPPQTYWGFAIPVILCTSLFLFAFWIYPSLHSLQDGELDDPSAYTDPHSLPENYFENQRNLAKEKRKKDSQSAYLKLSPTRHKTLKKKGDDKHKFRTWSSKGKAKESVDYENLIIKKSNTTAKDKRIQSVSPVADMDLDEVCQLLYL